VFLYYFDFPLARFPQGSPHWSEVPYVFGNFGWWDELQLPLRPEDLAASDLIRRYWVNFATSGNPNGPGLPVWPAFSETEQRAMVFGRMSGAQALPNLQRLRSFDAWYRCAWGANAF
jgi:para-nitrobenzyl esterase